LWVLKGSMFYFASKCLQEGRKPQKQSKMSQSCAKVAVRGRNCALARKRESCAKVALRNIAIFWGDCLCVIERWFHFQPHLSSATTLPWEITEHKNDQFRRKQHIVL